MTILYICDEYPPGMNGGIGTSVQLLSRELVNQGHKVFVVGLYSYYYGQDDYENDKGVEVYRLRYGLRLSRNINNKLNRLQNKLPRFLQKRLYGKRDTEKFIYFIKQLIDKNNIDVIEVPDWNTFINYIGFKFEWPKFKIPLIVKAHGSYTKMMFDTNQKIESYFFEIDQLLYKRADSIIAVSKNTAEITKSLFTDTPLITVLYNGIPVKADCKNTYRDNNKVLFYGSLTKLKGIHSLLSAWNLIRKEIPDIQLHIYGKGKIENLKKLLNPSAENSVLFYGHVSRDIILNELETSTIAVFPSYSETFGLTVIEAMSKGCPVIYTKRACGPEIIQEHINGELVDPDDINEIASKIITLIRNQDLQKKYSINGRKAVEERFDIKKSAMNHLSLYNQVINAYKI